MEISKKGSFGNSFFEIKRIRCDKNGLRIIKPENGTFAIYEYSEDIVHDFSEYKDGIIISKKGIFDKLNENEYVVIFINTCPLPGKGYLTQMIADINYDDVSCDISITYDISMMCVPGRLSQLTEFIRSNNFHDSIDSKRVYDKISQCIDRVIKNVIGKFAKGQSVEDIENCSVDISKRIISELNSNSCKLYDYGFEVTSFEFSVTYEYAHHQEKKKVEHNQAIKHRL